MKNTKSMDVDRYDWGDQNKPRNQNDARNDWDFLGVFKSLFFTHNHVRLVRMGKSFRWKRLL